MLDDVTEKTIKDTSKYFEEKERIYGSKEKIKRDTNKEADVILEVLPTNLKHDPSEAGKILRVRLI